jgi:hypothetical protein
MQMVWQYNDCLDRKRSFTPRLPKGRAEQIDVFHKPVALAISLRDCKEISSTG